MSSRISSPFGRDREFWHLNQKFVVALFAAGIAIWVMSLNVEIDSTIQTLILTLSPIIVAYWWPDARRPQAAVTTPQGTTTTVRTTTRKTDDWGLDPDVGVALVVAFVIYVGVQAVLAIQAAPPLPPTTTPDPPPEWAKVAIAVIPVVIGALTSPDQS